MAHSAEQSTAALLTQLTYSPLYILTVIIALGALILLRHKKGCLLFFYQTWAVGHIIIYLLAIYLYLIKMN